MANIFILKTFILLIFFIDFKHLFPALVLLYCLRYLGLVEKLRKILFLCHVSPELYYTISKSKL